VIIKETNSQEYQN